ncbi:MAG: thioredoxin [Rothia sp. (in: high G+C Gram-positive bacteria)]|uniref:thioredoxin n=1 Tax=Rothia sp. (in: high G+C Gram-positive bacteria) TaxID=1885016 RepID=UPI0026DF2D2B|nr:thioredoxin [Rothia sp. (in: high G+C Gram-positive bacteria)]MDO5749590.1 thioredoxin [Rothia sp. (in: high G+C Gram-positive bacteria)]
MSALNISGDQFASEVLSSDKPVIVDFWAEWCGPCRSMAPTLDEIAAENADTLKVVKVNVDTDGDIAAEYGVTSIPAIYLFKDGAVVKESVGARPKQALMALFAEHLN